MNVRDTWIKLMCLFLLKLENYYEKFNETDLLFDGFLPCGIIIMRT